MHAHTCRRIYTNITERDRQTEYDLKNKGSCLQLLYDTLEHINHGNIQEFEGPWRHRSSLNCSLTNIEGKYLNLNCYPFPHLLNGTGPRSCTYYFYSMGSAESSLNPFLLCKPKLFILNTQECCQEEEPRSLAMQITPMDFVIGLGKKMCLGPAKSSVLLAASQQTATRTPY